MISCYYSSSCALPVRVVFDMIDSLSQVAMSDHITLVVLYRVPVQLHHYTVIQYSFKRAYMAPEAIGF